MPSHPPLISISAPRRPLDRALLTTPGGFAWWYADLVDAQQNGAVFIWSYALPFLPGVASGARAGRPVVPRERPSLNVAIYERGELVDYLLQEYAPEDASWETDGDTTRWRFGQTTLRRTWRDDRVELDVRLSCALPGTDERLRGTFTLEGPARQDHQPGAPFDPHHDWTPMAGPARGVLDVGFGSGARRVRHHIEGRAYFDRNGGERPMHELGFRRWIWGRVPFRDHEALYYILWPQGGGAPVVLGLEMDAEGNTRQLDGLEVRLERGRVSKAGGMRWHERVVVLKDGAPWLSARKRSVIDEGPFYLRFFIEGEQRGERAVGTGEVCVPGRVDRALWRPLVQMRVHQDHAAHDAHDANNSMWAPLFTGPKQGRVGRLVRGILRGEEG